MIYCYFSLHRHNEHFCNHSFGGHGGVVVTHLPPTCEDSGSNPIPYVGKLIVAYRRSAVYSTEP